MGSWSPLAIALTIVALVAAVGLLLVIFRRRATFSGYDEIFDDVRELGAALKGEVFRDGDDLVISGTYRRLPVVIRFSHGENTPGLNIRLTAPSNFTLYMTPKGSTSEGRFAIKSGDDMFDARFTVRTDHPTEAKMFFTGNLVLGQLQKLCCSAKTFFSINKGWLELSELVIPEPYTARHILDHLTSMGTLLFVVREMPGAATVKIGRIEREGKVFARIAIAVGILAAGATVFVVTRQQSQSVEASAASAPDAPPEGVLPVDAEHITGVRQLRLATAEDLDPVGVAWLRASGGQLQTRIEGDFSGDGQGEDVAYVLTHTVDGKRRVVLLANGKNRFDATYSYLGVVARVPKSAAQNIEWKGKGPEAVDGDGLLLVVRPNDPTAGLVLFLNGDRVVSGSPANYQTVPVQ